MNIEPYNDDDATWISNILAIKLTRSINVMERLRAEDDRDMDERQSIAYAEGCIEVSRDEHRRDVARRCEPWFDGSCFDIRSEQGER